MAIQNVRFLKLASMLMQERTLVGVVRQQVSGKPEFFQLEATRSTILSPRGETINLPSNINWNLETSNVVYGIYSAVTGILIYVGKTKQPLKIRIQAHMRDIRRGPSAKRTDLVKFFNSDSHSVDDLQVIVFDKLDQSKDLLRREMDIIVKYDMVNNGTNMRYPMSFKKYHASL